MIRYKLSFKIILSVLCSLLFVNALCGCSTIRPLSRQSTLNGYPAQEYRIIVLEPYSFRPGLVTLTLPGGTYLPTMEDDEGVYFQSPGKLFLGGMFGPTLHDGGLFFKGGASSDVYSYVIIHEEHTNSKLPCDFKFRIERIIRQNP